MKQNGVIFDFDGTLIDSRRDITLAVNDVFTERGLPSVTEEAVEAGIGHGARELVEFLLEEPPGDEELDRMVKDFRAAYQSRCTDHVIPYDGMETVIESIGSDHTAIVTNKPHSMTLAILDQLEWRPHFEPVYGADSLKTMKPSPEPLHAVRDAWSDDLKSIVMIGDNWTDVAAGKRAGMVTVACEYGLGDTEALRDQDPDYRIQSPAEIPPVLQNIP